MGSAMSTDMQAKVEVLRKEGKSDEEICAEMKNLGLLGPDIVTKPHSELARDYKNAQLVELSGDGYKSADAIVEACVEQGVTGTLDLGCQGKSADNDPPGQLRRLKLDPISALPPRALDCTAITHLVLKSNRLEDLAGLGALVKLETLEASENSLKAVPDGLPPSLTALDLSENQIAAVPDSIGALVNLDSLMLFKNALSKLPDAMGALVKLRDFNIFNNKLIKLPKTMENCESLEVLNVGGNKLKTLPPTVKWTKMAEIKAHQNGLIMLPSLESMTSLTVLKIDMNRALEALDAGAGLTKHLELWETSNCNLSALPDALLHAHALVALNCTNNKLTVLPALELPNLEILNVSSNDLTELPVELGLCSKLKTLFFSNNHIKEIPSEYGALTLSIQRFNCSGQKDGKSPITLEGTCLANIKIACEKHNGRFIV